MHLLVFGGTQFVGLSVVEEALSRGHQVTIFNRGNHPAPPGATQIVGDRLAEDGLAPLVDKSFDVVVDTWHSDPLAVKKAVDVLRRNVKHFVYISTISVYDDAQIKPGEKLNEDTPVVDPAKPDVHPYSANKRNAEIIYTESGVPLLIPRPGLILGPGEGPMRLPWWLWRLQRGGRTLAPGPKENELRYVDSRDLANFVMDGVEKSRTGIYNTVSHPAVTTMGELLETAKRFVGGEVDFVWKESKEVLDADIKPWVELPIWMPPGTPNTAFVYHGDATKAYEAGLRVRSVEETVRDTWEWLKSGVDVPPPESLRVGVSPEKEAALLGDGVQTTRVS